MPQAKKTARRPCCALRLPFPPTPLNLSPGSNPEAREKKVGKELKMAGADELACAWSPGGEHRSRRREDDDQHGKRPVLARVKDMARRWRRPFGKKKPGRSAEAAAFPAGGISLAEKKDDEDPEFHGAPIYESATASHSEEAPPIVAGTPSPELTTMASPPRSKEPAAVEQSGKESADSSTGHREEFPPEAEPAPLPEAVPSDAPTLTQNVSELVMPAYNMVAGMTQAIASKIHGQPEPSDPAGEGGLVKKYLMEKLQPGEEEEALSQVITEAISRRNAGDGEGSGAGQGVAGTVDKLKGAVSSLLGLNEAPERPPAREAVSNTPMVSPTTEKMVAGRSEEVIPVSIDP